MLPMTPAELLRISHTLAGARATRIKNTPVPTACAARYSSAIRCLRSPRLQSITGMPGGRGIGPHPAGEPAREPHHVGVVQVLLGAAVQPPPPGPEPARIVPQRIVGVQHDPVHAVV